MDTNGFVNGTVNNNDYLPGSTVKGVKDNGNSFEGIVLSYSRENSWLVIQQPSRSNPEKSDVSVLSLKTLKEISTSKTASRQEPLPDLCISRMQRRRERNIEEMSKVSRRLGDGVSEHAQDLFDFISRTIPDVAWDKQDIVVMKSVVISPPYEVPHSRAGSSEQSSKTVVNETLKHVSKLMEKFSERSTTTPSAAPTSTATLHQSADIKVGAD